MGLVYTEITLKNAIDAGNVQRGLMREQDVRMIPVQALVDTGCGSLAIPESLREKLGLSIKGLRRSTLADGSTHVYRVTEPVEVRWHDRWTACPATILPDSEEVLLGAIPLEDMDLKVDPKGQCIIGAHGDEALYMLK